ncbi:MAG: aldo/keto reductase [Eubacteriales bacterium]|nr:aldo/keto reductase [Eubacteriales bacterium]
MEKTILNGTALQVSEIGIGGSHFGGKLDEQASFTLLDAYMEKGGNLVDTAHSYGTASCEEESPSEKTIGAWIRSRNCREQICLMTKGAHPNMIPEKMAFGPSRVSREAILHDLHMSLRTLQTDYVDLYFPHRDNEEVPVSEIIDVLEEERQKGTIRYYGCSNWKPERMEQASAYAEEKGYQGFVCSQVPANLAVFPPFFMAETGMLCMDEETKKYHEQTGMPAMPVMALANGYFQKRLAAHGGQLEGWPAILYNGSVNDAIYEKLAQLNQEGLPINSVLFAYVKNFSFQTVPILGFSSVKQMDQTLQEISVSVPEEVLRELEIIRKA